MSLRNKFLFVFSISLLLVSGLFVYVTIHLISNEWVKSKEETNLGFAKEEAREISEWISDQVQKAYLISVKHSISGNRNNVEFRSSFNQVENAAKQSGEKIGFLVYSAAKKIVYANSGYGIWTDSIRNQAALFFRELKKLRGNQADSREFRIGKVGRYIIIAVPLVNYDGSFDGMLNEIIDFESSAFATSLHDFTNSAHSRMQITDSLGGIITGDTIKLEVLRNNSEVGLVPILGKSGAFEKGNKDVVTYAKIRLTPWYVVVDQPITDLERELTNLEENYAWIIGLGILLIFVVSYVIADSMASPIRGLLKAMYRAADKDFSPVTVNASGELQLLINSFNRMAASLERKYNQIDALNEFSSSVIVDIRENNIFNRIGKATARALDVGIATVLMPDDAGNLKVKGPFGIPESEIDKFEVPANKGLSQVVYREGRSIVSNNADKDPVFYRGTKPLKHIRTFMSAPIIADGKTIGVLNVANTKDNSDFTPEDLKLLETFANQAGIAIQNSHLYKQLREDLERIEALQDELVQSEKLSAVGQLVSGVAHELNNPLGVILGFSELAKQNTNDQRLANYLQKIEESAVRASSIVKNLLIFARKETPKRTKINLNEVVGNVLDLIAHPLNVGKITVVREFQPDIGDTFANFQQLEQVFLNLFTNAMQAMEETGGGIITVKTYQDADRLKAIVSDNGPGIKAEIIGKIFDPFFTTKPVGKGTGLGLSVSYSILKSYGGDIKVESQEGKGATFIIELPAISDDAIEQEETELQLSRLNGVRVLFVEDEEEMRMMVKDALEKYGCKVSTAENGLEALDLVDSTQYDVILSDLRMPKMDGEEFYRKSTSKNPIYLKRFIFSSGDTARESTQDFLKETGCDVIMKPFTIHQLAAKILKVKSS
ncbi:MAG: ATP-binding protein [Bacteroidetes bacterium]|nr:ATP-binding protein [Bacteroidota bacterium]MCL5739151.1 ATP-binding protein [Bacteroidota bacterium]